MSKKQKLLILSILTVMTSSVALYSYKTLVQDDNSDLGQVIIEKIQNFQSDNSTSSASDVKYIKNEPSYKINSSNAVKVRSGFNSLSEKFERVCYKAALENADKITDNHDNSNLYEINPIVVKKSEMSSDQIKKVLYAVQNDYPEIFWLSSSFSYYSDKSGTTLKLKSIFSKSEQQKALDQLNKKVFNVISQIPYNSSDYEKEMFIHDYLVDNCSYSKKRNYNQNVFTAYGCLIDGEAVCEGYSRATQLLMCAAGFECRPVIGSRGNEPHMWNVVKLGNDWYHIDVTWENKDSMQKYKYFNLNDELIKKDHKIAVSLKDDPKDYYKKPSYNFILPKCNSLKDNYFEKNAVKVQKYENLQDDTIVKKLVQLKNRGENILYIKISDDVGFEKGKSVLLSNNSRLLFEHIRSANNSTKLGKAFNTSQIKYVELTSQNVLSVRLY